MIRTLLLIGLVLSGQASAHSASTSYLDLAVTGRQVAVDWAIALRDLDYVIGLDAQGDGAVTWGDVKAAAPAIDGYALSRLRLASEAGTCVPGPVEHLVDQHGDGAYLVLRTKALCPDRVGRLSVDYALLFDRDPQHRGLLHLTIDGTTHALALSPERHAASFDAGAGPLATVATFFLTGVDHLLGGIDHLLFVAMLLVPAMFRRRPDRLAARAHWISVGSFAPAFLETIKVLSAFTLAHALTLTSAALGYVRLPAQLTEAAIAATILLTALDNVWHLLPDRRWALAFGFGLIHGFGFASALGPLALPPATLALALLSFNLGLEAAQVGVAAILLPLGFLARDTALYRSRLLPGSSAAVAAIALLWLVDRAAGLQLMPF